MPTTYNGIGTHYYGKKNVQTRPGVCEHCGRPGQLVSYDTRLWFVIIFIPLIPLGRKRILDYCPSCTRHRSLPIDEWEELKRTNITEGMDAMRANPNDPEGAIKLHSRLVAFGQQAEADKLAATMKDRFANSAKAQAYLGSSMEYVGRSADALPFFQQALKLDPELPEARVAVARGYIQEGRLDDAHKLLKFLETPEAEGGAGMLYQLALGYQRAARHAEALELFKFITNQHPTVAQDKAFRKAVVVSEKATGASAALPPREYNWKLILGGSAAVIGVVGAVFLSNHYISQHRPLHIVSGLKQPVTITVDGKQIARLNGPGREEVEIPEGKHTAMISGAVTQKVDFVIRGDFFGRWFDKPVWVLNPGGSAMLMWERVTYSVGGTDEGGDFEVHFGEPFLFFSNIDYPFQSFPKTIKLNSSTRVEKRNRITVLDEKPADVFYLLLTSKRMEPAARLAEWHLRQHPEDGHLLPVYYGVATAAGKGNQAHDFVAELTKTRPVNIPAHRIYQSIHRGSAELAKMITEYDALLAAEPDDSALIYLRGRLDRTMSTSRPYFERAIAKDPKNAYAHFALGFGYLSAGEARQALPFLKKAVELQPAENQFGNTYFEARLAAADLAALERETLDQLKQHPLNVGENLRLVNILAIQNRTEEARKLCDEFEKKVLAGYAQEGAGYARDFKFDTAYALGDFEWLGKLVAGTKPPGNEEAHYHWLVETGNLQEIEKIFPADSPTSKDPFYHLVMSIAWHHTGNPDKAAGETERAVALLKTEGGESRDAATALEGTQAPSLAVVADVSLAVQQKAIWLIALSQRFPQQAPEYKELVRKLNVERTFPYHLLARASGKAQ